MQMKRDDMVARAELFDKFALKDQKSYYASAISKHRAAARQVNRLRASLSLATGIAAALAGLVVQASFVNGATCAVADAPAHCDWLNLFVGTLSILAILLPALGAALSTLADLYQWDRLIAIYETAKLNMEEADALSPIESMSDLTYRASMRAFAEGALQVMSDETAQWGQSIRTPRQLASYVAEEQRRVEQLKSRFAGGVIDQSQRLKPEDDDPPPPTQPPADG